MNISHATNGKLNITLPKDTINLLDKLAPKRSLNHFIDNAVKSYFNSLKNNQIRKGLVLAGKRRSERDLEIASASLELNDYAC